MDFQGNVEGGAQVSCLLPVDHFWYMSHVYKERIKHFERKNNIKIVAQVHVTFEAEGEYGRPYEALCEFTELSQSCSTESGEAVIPLKFVDPDQWSDALKVIKRSKDKLLLTMSSEDVVVCGPKQSQDEFSSVLNAMQNTCNPLQHLNPASDDTSLWRINHELNTESSNRPGYGNVRTSDTNLMVASTERGASGDGKEYLCLICLDPFIKKQQLMCKHTFCDECLLESIKQTGPVCPVCKDVYGVMEGDQPDGTIMWSHHPPSLPGFPGCGHIVITYNFPNGIQTEKHPNPGQPFQGTTRTAYLPDNKEGQEVLKLLKKAFDQKIIFTVGTSRTSGLDNQVIWNDISHKTSMSGGPQSFGYPDPNYLSRVKEDLKAKGIE